MIRKRVDKMDRSKMDNSVDVSAYIADGTRVAGSGITIGKNCIIGAGSLVTEGTVVPDGKMFFGRPARYVRDLTPEEIENNREIAEGYVRLKDEWMGRKSNI
jgi:carbonic anhydrase/acetyltransferase-like protein (isoleucine patch superfamily)